MLFELEEIRIIGLKLKEETNRTGPEKLIKKFKRDISSLDNIFEYISSFIEKQEINESTAFVLKLVVEEIFTNLVKYDPEADEEIPIGLSFKDSKIDLEFVNYGGHEFNIVESSPVDTEIPLQERKVGGLGLHLVRQLVDDVTYKYADGTSTIKIVKYLEE